MQGYKYFLSLKSKGTMCEDSTSFEFLKLTNLCILLNIGVMGVDFK